MQSFLHRPWANHIEEQNITPEVTYLPSDISDLINIVQTAERKKSNVKACGSRHSWSAICPTFGRMVLPEGLAGRLDLEIQLLQTEATLKKLVRVKSGTTIRALNDMLDAEGMAISWLGGFDGQTIAGVCQTSTHGGAIGKGPLYEMILSYDLVGSEGKLYRIEKTNGITNRVKFESVHPDFILIQDDKFYHAVSVGLGCLGIIYSVIIEVTEAYYLKEERTLTTWETEKVNLIKGDVFRQNFHYELMINPHPGRNRDHLCVITRRNIYKPNGSENIEEKRRKPFVELLAKINRKGVLNFIFNLFKSSSDELIDSTLKSIAGDVFINKSFKVFHIGDANYIPSYSSEIGFNMENDNYIKSIDNMLEVIEKNKIEKKLYHSAPIALRFVQASKGFLSPMYGQNTCMAEIIMAKDTFEAKEMYSSIERAMYALKSRMHWGQYNYLSENSVKAMYPALDQWKEVSKVLNSTGVFNNPFSNSTGLSN